MDSSIIFSILIPVYNTEKYLRRSLNSILNQTFDKSKIEVIIVNDGSPNTDLCDFIVNEYSKKLNIKYIKKEKNEGTFLARKSGVQCASGLLYLNLDPDDEHTSEAYQILYDTFNKNKNIDFIEFQIYEISDSITTYSYPDCKNRTLDDLLHRSMWVSMCYKCFNTRFLKKIDAEMDDFFSIVLEDFYQGVICEFYTKNKISIPNFLYKRYVGIGISAESNYNNYDKFLRMDMSVQNVFKYLNLFFARNAVTVYSDRLKFFHDKFYIDAFNMTSNSDVMSAILDRVEIKKIIPCILNKIEKINRDYNSLLPLARRINAPMKLLSKLKKILVLKK